jgi:hypothetical protein
VSSFKQELMVGRITTSFAHRNVTIDSPDM